MTIHPLLRLVVSQPHLVAEHLEAYAALVGQEVSKLTASLAVRIGLYVGAGVLALLSLLLIGVSLLLRATVDPTGYSAGWALIVVPLTPLLLAVIMVFIAR